MNMEATNRWDQTKSLIKARFGKLTDSNIESVKSNLDLLSGKLQSVYGYAKEQAEREYKGFKATLPGADVPTEAKGSKDVEPEVKTASEPRTEEKKAPPDESTPPIQGSKVV